MSFPRWSCSAGLPVLIALAAISLALVRPMYAASSSAAGAPRTPEQLVKDLIAAGQIGDVNGFLARLTTDSRKALMESLAGETSLLKAQAAFQQALDSRFGEGTIMLSDTPGDLKTAVARLVAAEILSKKRTAKDEVQLKVRTSVRTPGGQIVIKEETLVARQEKGSWKLVLGFAPDGGLVATQLAAANRIIQQVRDGAYKDPQSAMVALSNAWAGRAAR